MRTKQFAIVGLFALAVLFAGWVTAQTPDVLPETQKAREDFQQAELAVQKKQVSVESFQNELDKLTEQKGLWQREIVYAKGKLAYANEKWKNATTLGKQEDIRKVAATSRALAGSDQNQRRPIDKG